MTIRVYLVDDHALVRTGMKMILSGETDIEVVGEAETGKTHCATSANCCRTWCCATCTCPV